MKNELAELQMLLMDQQRSLESLSEQLIAQADKVLVLERKIEWLQSRLERFNELADQDKPAGDERPPHY
ncbi:SlyX family protein [Candidatus Spongiihabitans sp.]|uniref:SlyX family protein n=1 Tax=Candidatus Spongiihabitans sp. TaxID=3101308 RepID=UPI003C703B0E